MSALAAYAQSLGERAGAPLGAEAIREALASLGEQPWALELYGAVGEAGPLPNSRIAMMGPREALAFTNTAFDGPLPRRADAPMLFVWTCDSDGAAVFTGGSLAGMVAWIDHDEIVPVPRWASVASFLERLVALESMPDAAWNQPIAELPVEKGLDAGLRDRWLAAWEANPRDDYPALVALQLSGADDVPVLRRLLEQGSPWVKEAVCRLVGQWRLEELAVPVEQVVRPRSNATGAAILALRALRSTVAKRAVQRLERELGPTYEPYFRGPSKR